ncbi:MAG: NADH-quinone oxidoreductase subunit J [Thermoanaerobaculum sp.]|nr:NADH-quinone oxidoreductase subunit J [Thermoanaerobaculum sp.]MCX7895676.1 NADH-quinone oxidoreductase subunit J [Thermoanaerobaculum sp.]MDW7968050.1 NADH-quinone oxidoreductase subunit J [Thermoanaerobaculum sp.]
MEQVVFYLAGTVAVASALLAVSHRNPVVNVLSLIVTFFCVAVNFALLGADFLAGAQVLIYAGAILVLFLFVVMLLGAPTVPPEENPRPIQRVLGGFLAALVAAGGWFFFRSLRAGVTPPPEAGDTAHALGRLLVGPHLFAFELVSVVLLTALIGALVLVKRKH